jgi:hypothetical protein
VVDALQVVGREENLMDCYTYRHRIEQLDPQKDHVEIYQLSTRYEFLWDHLCGPGP